MTNWERTGTLIFPIAKLFELKSANAAWSEAERIKMADVLQPSEQPKPTSAADGVAALNLLDLTAPSGQSSLKNRPLPSVKGTEVTLPAEIPPTFHLNPSDSTALHLNQSFTLDPNAWNNTGKLNDVYKDGVIRLLSEPDGSRQFGVKVKRGVALEFRLKF
jgi:hypothetical protein